MNKAERGWLEGRHVPSRRRNSDNWAIHSEPVPAQSQVGWHTPVRPELEGLRQEKGEFKSRWVTSWVMFSFMPVKYRQLDLCSLDFPCDPKRTWTWSYTPRICAQDKDKYSRSICSCEPGSRGPSELAAQGGHWPWRNWQSHGEPKTNVRTAMTSVRTESYVEKNQGEFRLKKLLLAIQICTGLVVEKRKQNKTPKKSVKGLLQKERRGKGRGKERVKEKGSKNGDWEELSGNLWPRESTRKNPF